jgi:hypothetical protein
MAGKKTSIPSVSKTRKSRGVAGKTKDFLFKYGPTTYMALDIGEGVLQGLGLMNKGGKVGKTPKGCGAAMRGYGKAISSKKGKK